MEAQKLIYVPSEGPSNASIVIVGEAPGETEEAMRRPFVGRSGKLVREIIDGVCGCEHVKITNAVCVRPKNNRTPTTEEIESWLPHLKEQIKGAEKIIALGRIAQTALTKAGIDDFHMLYHPA